MQDQLDRITSQRLFIILSLFFIGMTIALTVVQSSKRQSLESNAAESFPPVTISPSPTPAASPSARLSITVSPTKGRNTP